MSIKLILAVGLVALFFAETSSNAQPFPLTVSEIAQRIRTNSVSSHAAYTNSIPGTKASYAMVPIPGGEFVMGSPAGQRYVRTDELPAHRVKLEPFWMGKCEVTWDEYAAFVYSQLDPQPVESVRGEVDAVTHPSLPAVDLGFGLGRKGYPAIAMTQHAANKYCQWLSARTGHFYRLPTEAEWEYAARAGSSNTWYFGEDEKRLGEFARFAENSTDHYGKVGRKRPNVWGLYDMLGNVSEWVLDHFDKDFYARGGNESLVARPWNQAHQPYPHAIRGGSWRDSIQDVRCAARGQSTRDWKIGDPALPKSIYWFRNCDFVGFRIVRPMAIPTTEEMRQYWNSGVERE